MLIGSCCPCCSGRAAAGATRRAVLAAPLIVLATPAAALPERPARALAAAGDARHLSLSHAADGETWQGVYWRDGAYLPDALAALDRLMRDRTAGSVGRMDPGLYDILFLLDRRIPGRGFVVVSAFRTAQTQAELAARWGRAAANSLHVEGRAVDVRRPGLHALGLVGAANALGAGGVGLYRGASPYVHLDTGPVRRW
jgi:uncharacterized protein YcbK (DUF882 family)